MIDCSHFTNEELWLLDPEQVASKFRLEVWPRQSFKNRPGEILKLMCQDPYEGAHFHETH